MRYATAAVAALSLASDSAALSVKPAAMPTRSSAPRSSALFMQEAAEIEPPPGWEAVPPELWSPEKTADIRIEGGASLETFKMPSHAERVQYILQSPNGRPTKGLVELWIGPIRNVHQLKYDCMNGGTFPVRATLQFKKLSPVLKVSTFQSYEFPLLAGVFVPSPEESKKIGAICEDMFYSAPMKERLQGGSTIDDKGGAIRTFNIDTSWEKTQIMVWSKDVGKKSFKTDIEILQGPNNPKQKLGLRCGGSTQPYHCVIETPGAGWMIRCNNKKYLEDGLFEIAVAPFGEPSAGGGAVTMGGF